MKKFLSLVLTGALALGMLTACGGSSGGSSIVTGTISYDNSRIAAATKQFEGGDAKIVLNEKSSEAECTISTHSGRTYYKRVTKSSTWAELEVGGNYYVVESSGRNGIEINPAYSFAIKLEESDTDTDYVFNLMVPTKESSMSITAGTINFGGKEYYTETVLNYLSSEGIGVRDIYAFDGNDLKYIFMEAGGLMVYEVKEYTSSVDESLFELPEKQITEDEYYQNLANSN